MWKNRNQTVCFCSKFLLFKMKTLKNMGAYVEKYVETVDNFFSRLVWKNRVIDENYLLLYRIANF